MLRPACFALLSLACATASGGDPDGAIAIIADGGPGDPDALVATPDAASGGDPDAATATDCTVSPQSGCMAGEACEVNDMGATFCRSAGSGTATAECAAPEDCAAAYTCIGIGDDTSCMKYCAGDGDCPDGAGDLCVIGILDAAGNPIPGVSLCSQNCDPVSSAGCPAGWGCGVFVEGGGAMRILTQCLVAGPAGQDAPCIDNSSCQAGFACVSVNTGGVIEDLCLKNCNVSAGGPGCPGISACASFTPPTILGGVEYGVCL